MFNRNKTQHQYLSEYLPYSFEEIFEYAQGGIHIDPSKRGTFKAQATRMDMGVQEAAAHILANKEDYSPAMVKKANFARNFAKEYGGEPQNAGFQALPEYVQEKILDNMAYGGDYDLADYKEGGYTVRRTNDRKGKTHVVIGPDGTKKYFGDPKMGERGKSKLGKEAFYARHADNLKKNPYFRAYARATWEEGGEIEEYGKGGQHGGLDRWFAEKWVDVKTGKECGRQEGDDRKGYPACRPSRRVNSDTPKTASELSSSEKEKFKREKTSSERISYQHRRKEDGGYVYDENEYEQLDTMKSGGNVPTNPSLWSRAKAAAKAKYDVYPSAYANGFAAKWYKSRGGGWKKAEMGGCMECGGQMENGGEPQNEGFKALPDYVQEKILSNMKQEGGQQQEQIMQIIQMFAQLSGMEPQQVISELQKLKPEQQQAALEQMVEQVQSAMQQQESEQTDEEQMQFGGPSRYRDFTNNSYNRNAMSLINMMDPSKSAIPYLGMMNNKVGAVANILGGLGSLTGLGMAAFGERAENPYEQQVKQSAKQAANVNPNLNFKQPNVANNYFKPQMNSTFQKYGMPTPNATFQKYSYNLPNQYDFLNNFQFAYGGTLPKAQFGKNDNLPFSLNTTGNYSDYSRTPDPGYQYDINTPFQDVAANLNINPQFGRTHKRVVNNNSLRLNSQKAGMIGLNALSGINRGLSQFADSAQQRRLASKFALDNNSFNGVVTNNPSPFGDNLTNVQAGAPQLKPNMYVPIQDIGTTMYAKYGGQYQQGGEYRVSEDELIQLMRDGAEIEFLD